MPSASTRALYTILPFLALALLAPRAAHAQRCAPGVALDVEWNQSYYPAIVKRGPDTQGRCLVAYDGYEAKWDEWVTPARMRARGAGAGTAAPTATATRAGSGPGAVTAPVAGAAPGGRGAQYGAHDPRPCPTVEATANRPPDLATATAAVICAKEGVRFGNSLFLLSNVRLQVGRGTPYRLLNERGRPPNADVTATVYSIRGDYTHHLCSPLGGAYPAGQNCTRYDSSRAEGWCYRDNFGKWTCDMDGGETNPPSGTSNQPPPRD